MVEPACSQPGRPPQIKKPPMWWLFNLVEAASPTFTFKRRMNIGFQRFDISVMPPDMPPELLCYPYFR